jgi:hypothetical protein
MRVESRGGGSCGSPSGDFKEDGGGVWICRNGIVDVIWNLKGSSITGSWFVSYCSVCNKGLGKASARLSVLVFTGGLKQ